VEIAKRISVVTSGLLFARSSVGPAGSKAPGATVPSPGVHGLARFVPARGSTPVPTGAAGDVAGADMLRLFAIAWAVVTLFHVWVNPRSQLVLTMPRWEALPHVGLTLAALWVLRRPGQVHRLLALAAVQVLSAWVEMPFLGNHWLLAALVALGLLLAGASSLAHVRVLDAADIARRFLPVGRATLLVSYGFAAFSKLNEGFFTPSRSCAPFYAGELLNSFGLPTLPDHGPAAWATIIGTVATECSVPLLLIVRRTRHAGVLLGLLFHGLLAFDRTHFFTDFSAVLVALFLLFLPPSFAVWTRAWSREHVNTKLVVELVTWTSVFLSLLLWIGAAATVPRLVGGLGVLLWAVFAAVTIGAVVTFLWTSWPEPAPRIPGISPRWLAAVPLLALVNGLTPYLELKTAFGWNMYSNLVTVGGRSNHLLVPRTWPLSDAQRQLVTVLETNDATLRWYAEARYRIPLPQLRTYTAQWPGGRLRYELNGVVRDVPHIGSDPVLSRPVPGWRVKLQVFRAVDMADPPRCQDSWGAAR
jgi:hypothetical protein